MSDARKPSEKPSDPVRELRTQLHQVHKGLADHARGCEGRNYSCDCGYDEEVQELCGKAEQMLEGSMTWQPIETAPKAGKAVLLASKVGPDDAMVVVGWWDEDREGWARGDHKRLRTAPTVWCELPDLQAIPAAEASND